MIDRVQDMGRATVTSVAEHVASDPSLPPEARAAAEVIVTVRLYLITVLSSSRRCAI